MVNPTKYLKEVSLTGNKRGRINWHGGVTMQVEVSVEVYRSGYKDELLSTYTTWRDAKRDDFKL